MSTATMNGHPMNGHAPNGAPPIPTHDVAAAVMASIGAKPIKSTGGDFDVAQAIENINNNSIIIEIRTKRHGNKGAVDTADIEVDADKDQLSIRKNLLDSDEWQAIKNFDQQTYRWLQQRAMKSNMRPGFYRLPLDLFTTVDAFLKARVVEREALVDAFVAAYPALQAQAVAKLRKVYRAEDYASAEQVRSNFSMAWFYKAETAPAQLAVISQQAYDEAVKNGRSSVQEEVKAMVAELRFGFSELVRKMAEKLQEGEDGKAKAFKPSTVDNLKQFLDLFDKRNLAGDKALADLVNQARTLMDGRDRMALIGDDEARDQVRTGFAGIVSQLDRMGVVDKPNRKLRIVE